MCNNCKCKKEIVVEINANGEGKTLVKARNITYKELKRLLQDEYLNLFNENEINCSFIDFLKDKGVECVEYNPPVITI